MIMKIKYIVLCLLLALVGCQRDEEMERAWVEISNEVIQPGYNYVRISSTIFSNATIDRVTILLSTKPDYSNATHHRMERQNDGKYSVAIGNLTHSTTYYVRYQTSNSCSSWISATSKFQTTTTKTTAFVTTSQAKSILYFSAKIGGNVIDDGGLEVTERGVVYSSTDQNPTIKNGIVVNGSGLGLFDCILTDLRMNTTYYARAYAINEKGIAYGEEVSFTTIQLKGGEGIENGYVYVDLGLSVKWATMNVGADSIEDYGDYFAWGETEPKDYYLWSTYKWCNGSSNTLTKYNTDSSYGTVDNKTQLDLTDDAARANWGGAWRIPTRAEQDELRHNCTWTYTTQNGVKGYTVNSERNGNSIFLPIDNKRYSNSTGYYFNGGTYWSSSLNKEQPDNAWMLSFEPSYAAYGYITRAANCIIRPVCP